MKTKRKENLRMVIYCLAFIGFCAAIAIGLSALEPEPPSTKAREIGVALFSFLAAALIPLCLYHEYKHQDYKERYHKLQQDCWEHDIDPNFSPPQPPPQKQGLSVRVREKYIIKKGSQQKP